MPRALLALLLCGTFALGCGKAKSDARKPDLDSTGVDECDGYVAKVAACAGKLPPELRASHEAAIATARDLLEERAGLTRDDDAKADPKLALKTACKQMETALAQRSFCN